MTQKQEINRCMKKWYKYYLSTINSDDFKNFCMDADKRSTDEYLKSIEDDAALASRVDFQSDANIKSLTICDMVDNEGFTELISRIHKLSSKQYTVDCRYRKPTLFRKYDYIHLKFNSRGYGSLADIKLLNDPYVHSIEILSSQINNYFAIIEYKFHFKKIMGSDLSNEFICYNIPRLTKRDYKPFYYIGKDDSKVSNYNKLEQARSELFSIICQHYITSILYSKNGQYEKLPSLCFYNRNAAFNIDTFAGTQFGRIFYNKSKNFVIEENFENNTFRLFSGNNTLPRFCVSELISYYGNDFYYAFLGQQFIKNFELMYSKYISRKQISNKDLSNLLKFYYGISDESILHQSEDLVSNFNKDWVLYCGYEKMNFEQHALKTTEKYKTIFLNMYEHCKAQIDIKTTSTGRITSYCALGISVISVILSLILHFC